MPIVDLPIFCYYDKQRFTQFGSMDCANWYGVQGEGGKKKQALYPTMGRQHVNFFNVNRLIFNAEPRAVFKTINYFYVIVGTDVIQVDKFYNQKVINPTTSITLGTTVWFSFLAVNNIVYAILTDEVNAYVITESPAVIPAVSFGRITDPNLPVNPIYIATFGNRFVISSKNTPNFSLSQIDLGGSVLNLNTCFTVNGVGLFARASGVINQMGVLHNQLYIFCDFTTDIWQNIPTQLIVANVITEFPWKLNTSYNWDYGLADPFSLDIDFGRMVWLGRNNNGLVTFLVSTGAQPVDFASQAIDVLLERSNTLEGMSPFLTETSDGFMYQYENTIFYRVSAGQFLSFGLLDLEDSANCIEYNFDTKTWNRVIELNGGRCRIQKHIYFNNQHLVTVLNDRAMYQMAGNIYHNELLNPLQPNVQAPDAFLKFPMRYELVTQQIYADDYSEFIDDYVEIDFVFGDMTFYRSNAPFINTEFLITETSSNDSPVYLVTEDGNDFIIGEKGNTPSFDDTFYNALFKPHIELYYSDDGGNTFTTADLREFSPLGQYRWRMRWYELAISRNRCYRLVCVSSAPIVILGAVRSTRRSSGGAN